MATVGGDTLIQPYRAVNMFLKIQGDVRLSVSFSFLYFLKSAARPASKSCFICSATCLSTCALFVTDETPASHSGEEEHRWFSLQDQARREEETWSDRLGDAPDDALRDQREHRREVEADGHLDVALEALPPFPLPLRVHEASDGERQVRRHGVAVQTIQLVICLLVPQ
jgi:hypothetical protein